jgi:hypothetical protein
MRGPVPYPGMPCWIVFMALLDLIADHRYQLGRLHPAGDSLDEIVTGRAVEDR